MPSRQPAEPAMSEVKEMPALRESTKTELTKWMKRKLARRKRFCWRHRMGWKKSSPTFGDIYDYIRPGGQLDPRWQADHLVSVELPFSLPLAWDPSKSING